MCRVTMRVAKIFVEIEDKSLFWSTMLKEHVETLYGVVRLIIVRVESFRSFCRPLGIFSSTAFVSAIEITVETEAFLVDGVQRAC